MLTTCPACLKTVEILDGKIIAHRVRIAEKKQLCVTSNKSKDVIAQTSRRATRFLRMN